MPIHSASLTLCVMNPPVTVDSDLTELLIRSYDAYDVNADKVLIVQ